MDKAHNKYNRVVLKLSGEAMAGDAKVGIDPVTVKAIAEEIKRAYETGCLLYTSPSPRDRSGQWQG